MIIKSLQEMERIVSRNKVLSWDGWTVVESRPKEFGLMSNEGALVNGRWIIQKRYDSDSNGWEIPNKFVG